VVNAPIIHAQNIKDPTQAVRVLEGGYVDMVGMTRAHIADPHFVNKVREDRVDEIRQCVGANYCIDRQYQGLDVLCIQNAATSREHKGMPHIITKTEGARRKVVVVGGGPGGMEAARVAAERGHDVTLIEKQDALGGQIGIAARAPQRDQIGGITRWFQMELDRLGVDQRLGTTASAESVLALNPDIVVLATGGSPFIDQSPEWGASDGLVLSSWDVLSGAVEPGKNVLIYDPQCEWSGMSVADYCAAKGSLVEIVTDDVKPGLGAGGTTFPTFYRSLYEKEVVMSSDLVLEKVYAEGDKRVAVLKNEYTEQLEERLVDQIIVENGVRPDEALYYALKPDSRNRGQVDVHALFNDRPQPSLSEAGDGYLLFRIGDCVSQRNAHAAIYDALRICKDF
jgi:NADPH-dependent 2,4-dienoyl-CoA reductase/sulfur reductase-like enzyme